MYNVIGSMGSGKGHYWEFGCSNIDNENFSGSFLDFTTENIEFALSFKYIPI